MILALLRAGPESRAQQIELLAAGILEQQRADGSYKVYFEDLPDYGEELYAGEAMLALIETYAQLRKERYLEASNAGAILRCRYFRCGRVSDETLVSTRTGIEARRRASHRQRGVERDVANVPLRHATESLASAANLSGGGACPWRPARSKASVTRSQWRSLNDARAERYRHCLCVGLAYLLRLQCTVRGPERERGGFGMSLDNRAQRIDVTGHAASAFIKCIENDVDCSTFGSNDANGA
jgi:hypothetical protein